uniref:Uncharacterized protein n=1 Tax=Anguilla anguilla TaxID=7936 RepID=A0A0E9UAR0_ANGAN
MGCELWAFNAVAVAKFPLSSVSH